MLLTKHYHEYRLEYGLTRFSPIGFHGPFGWGHEVSGFSGSSSPEDGAYGAGRGRGAGTVRRAENLDLSLVE